MSAWSGGRKSDQQQAHTLPGTAFAPARLPWRGVVPRFRTFFFFFFFWFDFCPGGRGDARRAYARVSRRRGAAGGWVDGLVATPASPAQQFVSPIFLSIVNVQPLKKFSACIANVSAGDDSAGGGVGIGTGDR